MKLWGLRMRRKVKESQSKSAGAKIIAPFIDFSTKERCPKCGVFLYSSKAGKVYCLTCGFIKE
jgi:uncharacterized Zn finger protein (UPF0148 family)